MRVLLTGGSGDLGRVLARLLRARGDTPMLFDPRPPVAEVEGWIRGDVRDRAALRGALVGNGCVVHIAAWHGIHEARGERDTDDFWDLNVTGTYNVFEAAVRAGLDRVVFLSSTSIDQPQTVYGHSKVLGEEIAGAYAARHGLRVLILRPRAFIPYWNRAVYADFAAWARWFWPGAVHIDDVGRAALAAVDWTDRAAAGSAATVAIDGRYDYAPADLAAWDEAGPGTTFRRHYAAYEAVARAHGLDPALKPAVVGSAAAARVLGYAPTYGHGELLAELERWGAAGPPPPDFAARVSSGGS